MTDLTLFRQRLGEDETALDNLIQLKGSLDIQIDALKRMIQISKEVIYREEPEQDTTRTSSAPPWGWGSKRTRIHNGIEKILAEHGTMHRRQI
jgi:hypothetical protein